MQGILRLELEPGIAVSLHLGLERGKSVKIPVEKLVTIWYYNTVVYLSIIESFGLYNLVLSDIVEYGKTALQDAGNHGRVVGCQQRRKRCAAVHWRNPGICVQHGTA